MGYHFGIYFLLCCVVGLVCIAYGGFKKLRSKENRVSILIGSGALLFFFGIVGFFGSIGTKLDVARGIEKQVVLSRDGQTKRKLNKEDVPREILSKCQDARGQVADLEEDWNFSDVIDSRPQSRLTLLCRYPDQSWLVYCEAGGFTVRSFEVLAKSNPEGYLVTVVDKETPRRCPLSF